MKQRTEHVDWLGYVESPDWAGDPGDWRQLIGPELRGIWASFSYEQKWAIAQNANALALAHAAAIQAATPPPR